MYASYYNNIKIRQEVSTVSLIKMKQINRIIKLFNNACWTIQTTSSSPKLSRAYVMGTDKITDIMYRYV